MKDRKITTKNAQETQEIAGKFVGEIMASREGKGGDKADKRAVLICLWGDLGSGKTTFSQGMAKALGVRETVNSPTFLIMKKYLLSGKRKGMNFYHLDLYRIKDKQEILDLGWKDILNDKNDFVVVEWPEKIGEILPEKRIDIKFDSVSEDERNITFRFL